MAQNKAIPKALQGLMKRAPRATAPLGTIGRYQLLEVVGSGGHGRVYRAMDPDTQTPVAIKILHDDVKSPELELRMKREAYAMGRLAGTCAAAIYECAQTPTGQLYLVMEFLDGQDLESLMLAQEQQGLLLPAEIGLSLLAPVVTTLEVAHSNRIIHRDLKPENIFVLADGQVRLVDFGLVKDLGLAKLTEVGVVAGSPGYIAPEAWVVAPDRLDHRIDVYALGVIIYRLLSGQKPFEPQGNTFDFIVKVTTAPRPSLHAFRPDLHPAIDTWVAGALAIKPEERFPSVTSLWGALRSVLTHSSYPPQR